jgi:decaprenylphospho-beta-D-erythro-pentofuranosid-2-ulose 2-reductase
MKNVIIIGATSGIAQALARQLAGPGRRLMLWARSRPKLEIITADLKARGAAAVDVDVFDFDDFSAHKPALDRALALGDWDAAVICHGTLGDQSACEKDFAFAEKEFRNNCLSALSFLTLLANYFEKRGSGVLAAISSVAGDRGRASNYVYGTAKAAVTVFLQGLRNRLASKGVHVLTIKPGFVATAMTAHLKQGPLFAAPEKVARDIVKAMERKSCVLYTPWFWRWIMLVIKLIPETIFRRLKL